MLNFAIIGYGKMGKIRHQSIQQHKDCCLLYVYDPGLEEKIPEYTNDLDGIFQDPRVDAVFICTPNHLNYELTIRSLEANKHTFCEKPPCLTKQQADHIALVKAKMSCRLMYGLNHRHHQSILHMKSLIDSGEMGKVLWMRGRYGKSVPQNFMQCWRSQKALSGGGILMDQGIHMLDLLLHLGADFDVVQAMISNLYWKGDIEDNAFINLKNTQTGLVASLHSTMSQWRHLFSLEVFLEGGYMVLNGLKTPSGSYGNETLTVANNVALSPEFKRGEDDTQVFEHDDSWNKELEHFVESIHANVMVKIGNINDAIKLITLVEKIYAEAV